MPWLSLIPWKIVGVVAAMVAFWGYGYIGGINHERDKQIIIAAKQLEAAIVETKRQDAITLETERKVWEAAQQVREVTKTIVKVIKDEKPSVNCELSDGWVQRHNEASANALPQPASSNHEALAGVTADQALEAVAENYGTCYEIRNIALGCQNWIKQQQQPK